MILSRNCFLLCLFATTLPLLFTNCKLDKKTTAKDTTTLNLRLESPATSINPIIPASGYSNYLAARIFQTLGEIEPKTLEMVPLLAKSIPTVRTVTEGPKKGFLAYDFEINEAAVWDNGTPITANDVIFTLKLIHHPGIPSQIFRSYFIYLDDLVPDAANPKKFTAYYSRYYMLSLESMCQTPIYPAYHYDPNNQLANISLKDLLDPGKLKTLEKDPRLTAFATAFMEPKYSNDKDFISGSGPYKLESMNGDQGAILVRKEQWWGDKVTDNPLLTAYPKRMVYKVVRDEAAVENMLRNGELDIVTNMSAANYQRLREDADLKAAGFDFPVNPGPNFSKWVLNTKNPKLADARVRRALAYVVDYDYLINNIQQGMAQRILAPISPQKAFYAKDIPLYDFNIAKATALLSEAGWADTDKDGVVDKVINGKKTPLTIDVLAGTNTKTAELVIGSIRETAKQAGVAINIVPADLEKIRADTKSGNFESANLAAAIYPGLVEFYQSYHSASLAPAGDNRSRFSNPQADSLFTAIRTTSDEATRNALYIKAQQLLHDEAPEIFLYSPAQRYIVNNKFDYMLSFNRPGYYDFMFKGRSRG
jgi:peptide/nickel transport system substrate-binding protein